MVSLYEHCVFVTSAATQSMLCQVSLWTMWLHHHSTTIFCSQPQSTKCIFNHLSADSNRGPAKSSGDNAHSVCQFCQSGLRRVESIFWASGEHCVYCPGGHWPAGSLPCVCCPPLSSDKLGGERREPGLATVTRDTAAWVRPPVSGDFWLFCHEMATIIHCQAITPDISHQWLQPSRG